MGSDALLASKMATASANDTPKQDVADLLVAYLEQVGVEYVFGIPGGAIEPLYNAIARSERRGRIRHILARHESGAAFMADGYARESGKIGVCCATSGPGTTNLITGIASAYDNGIPLLVITGQPALPAFGKNPLQESSCTGINTLGMLRYCTHFNSLVSHPEQMEAKLFSALQRTTRPPQGPSHLSVPIDVFRSPHRGPSYDLHNLLSPSALVDDNAIKILHTLLSEARHILLLIGSGCGEATDAILQFAAMMGASFVTTPDGKGLINPRHPLYRGVFGFGGHETAETAMKEESVDLVLAIGTSMGEWNSGGWCASLLNERLVHIDESEEHLSRTPMARLHVRGRIQTVFNRLLEHMVVEPPSRLPASRKPDDWSPHHMLAEPGKYLSEATPIKPQRLMRELGQRFPANTRFLADTGNSLAWSIHYLHPDVDWHLCERRQSAGRQETSSNPHKSDGGWLRVTMNFAAMGWAIGAAIGTAIANPAALVVCITGDGSMLMNGQELSVAVAEKLKIIFVVLNDSSLGMVRHGQQLAGAEQISCFLPPVDFAMLARALGAEAYTIRSPEDFDGIDIEAFCGREGPVLLDIHIDPNEIPPMSVRMRALANTL